MRFNGVDVRDIHPRISISKEIPPGCPERTVETVQGWDGETFAAVRTEQGEYVARINIACRTRDDAWEARSRLARWAASSGDGVGELEPTHWPGKAYEAVLGSISAPEFTFGFATVDVTFVLPRPYAHDTYISRASGTGGAEMAVSGDGVCRPTIRQTIAAEVEGLTWKLDGKAFLTLVGTITAEAVVEMDTKAGSLTVNGSHAESLIDYTASLWRSGFTPGVHKITSTDRGQMEASWRNEWM